MYQKQFQDIHISALGLGSLHLPEIKGRPDCIDRAEAQKVIDAALDSGLNYIDTAYTYHNGDSERFLGEALERYSRESYYLASKFYVPAGIGIREMFEEQLRRCRTEYFDFYLLHGMDENSYDLYTDSERDYVGYLLEQKKAGRIRYLGFSSHAAPDTLSRFLDWYSDFDMALIQLNYLDWTILEAKKQYELLTARGIPVWVMEPLKGGRLSVLNPKAAGILKEAAPDRSLSSWAFRFLMGLDNVQTVLSGMSSVSQVLDNARTFEKPDPLNERERKALRKAADVFMEDMGVPCSGCRYCCSVCPEDLDIPLLIKGYNEYRISKETWRVAGLMNQGHSPKECRQCGACSERCPQKICIPDIVHELAELLEI